ncbi:DUF2218 domain-containing protein [Pseudoponticoccus marisrubri]|uniref:2,4-dihydroxyhept-2-ene-1,7-dioic acid aldolase n=1 Tax=Pseudoponticoccus marisrubri TaxID=1685382 RepID=A0A0W7WKL9_9RHOB|nr:DUF2218 domain-containing protein [Pseudoponticoccus marisrubri]KUF11078.1 2,4-dihydroxyhept-2-ene-1,7-dioic acid aldolase [Pseudoponticoccus marisrubri]
MPLAQTGRFETAHASKYLQQLCKHFAHKVEVSFDSETGTAALPAGPARLQAADGALTVTVTGADADALDRARHVIDSHLARFAFREGFETMDWTAAQTTAAQTA